MSWMSACSAHELSEGQRQVVTLEDKKILLAHENGQIFAMISACPHFKLPLTKGEITKDDVIICPWHKSAFDLKTGDVKEWSPWPPGLGKVLGCFSRRKVLKLFKTKVEAEQVWVDV